MGNRPWHREIPALPRLDRPAIPGEAAALARRMPMPALNEADLAARLAQAGISLPKPEQDDLRAAHALLAPMLDAIRQPLIPPAAEPGVTFAAGSR